MSDAQVSGVFFFLLRFVQKSCSASVGVHVALQDFYGISPIFEVNKQTIMQIKETPL